MPNLYVICRKPLPSREDGWSFQAGPVFIAREAATGNEASMLKLTSPNFASGLLAEAVGELIARGTSGVLLAEGQRLIADFDGSDLDDDRDFEQQLAELLFDLEAEQIYEANDWSEVDSAA